LSIKAESEAQISISKTRTKGEVQLAELAAYNTSQVQGNTPLFSETYLQLMFNTTGWVAYIAKPIGALIATLFAFVDVARGATRPLITWYYAAASLWITWTAYQALLHMGREMMPHMAHDVWSMSITTIQSLSITCVTWWFADRRIGKALTKNIINKQW
jgi:hypothetical protein